MDVCKHYKREGKRGIKQARGATRDISPSAKNNNKWGRKFLWVLCVSGLGYGASQIKWQDIYRQAYQATNRPLANVRIESEFKYVSQKELETLISNKLDGSFVDLDLSIVKTEIEQTPWIDTVKIERLWPDSIRLIIEEQKPIARWKENAYINREGDLIEVESNESLAHLPLLSGQENRRRDVIRNYVVFKELLASSDLKLSSLIIDKKMSWMLQIENFVLNLGRDDIQQKLGNFKFVYDRYLKEKKSNIRQIDMRYKKGLAVQWNQESEYLAANTAP